MDLLWQPVPYKQGRCSSVPGGCKTLYGATGAGIVSEERKGEQRATFPIINKAATPSILMRQAEKTSSQAVSTQ